MVGVEELIFVLFLITSPGIVSLLIGLFLHERGIINAEWATPRRVAIIFYFLGILFNPFLLVFGPVGLIFYFLVGVVMVPAANFFEKNHSQNAYLKWIVSYLVGFCSTLLILIIIAIFAPL